MSWISKTNQGSWIRISLMLGIAITLYSLVKSETLSVPTTIRRLIDANYADGTKRAAAAAERVSWTPKFGQVVKL